MKPKCFYNGDTNYITNRGHLIPCCYCDEDWALKTIDGKNVKGK